MGAGREAEAVDRPAEEARGARPSRAAGRAPSAAASSCGVRPGLPAPLRARPAPRRRGPATVALGSRGSPIRLVAGEARHLDVEVDAIERRARQPRPVGLGAPGRADAAADGVAVEAAGARVARAETRSGRAGKRALAIARATSIRPSSSGWRRASRAEGAKAQTSSRKSTPWWARLTSPGRGRRPPPTRPAAEIVWWGARKGRRMTSGQPGVEQSGDRVDAGDRDRLVERAAAAGAPAAGARASSCRRPGGPIMSIEWPPAAATSSARRAAP